MKMLIILILVTSCGLEDREREVSSSLCMGSCVQRNLQINNDNSYDTYKYCEEIVLPHHQCFKSEGGDYYYR